MSRMMFVNLPVADLGRSVGLLHAASGFEFNEQFTDENATCMVVSDQAFVMLLVEPFFALVHPQGLADARTHTEAILSVSRDQPRRGRRGSTDTALALGATPANDPQDDGFMYGRSFHDLDGHAWEVHLDGPGHRGLSEFSHPQHRRSTPGTSVREAGPSVTAPRGGRRAVESPHDDVRPTRFAGDPGPALRRAGGQHPRAADLPRRRWGDRRAGAAGARQLGAHRRRRARSRTPAASR